MKLVNKLILLVVILIPLEAVIDYYLVGVYSGFGIGDYVWRCFVETICFVVGISVGLILRDDIKKYKEVKNKNGRI